MVGIWWKTLWCSTQRRMSRPIRVGSFADQHLKRVKTEAARSPTTANLRYWRRGYLNWARQEHWEIAPVRLLLN
jgi:hypothetical protein